jgi:hypothetical protein
LILLRQFVALLLGDYLPLLRYDLTLLPGYFPVVLLGFPLPLGGFPHLLGYFPPLRRFPRKAFVC